MPFPYSVLCYGHDSCLLTTRQQILERAGFATEIVGSQQEFEHCLQEYSVDLVLLCHSLTTAECEYVKQAVHVQAEPTLLLLLSKGVNKCSLEGVDALFNSGEGPSALIRFITTLLIERGRDCHVPRLKKPITPSHHPWSQSSNRALHV